MKLFLIGLIFIATAAKAAIVTGIARVEPPYEGSDMYQILAHYDGRIFEVDKSQTEILETLSLAQGTELKVSLDLEKGHEFDEISGARIIGATFVYSEPLPLIEENLDSSYDPSNVSSMAEADRMFDGLTGRTRWFTQCFNRAHIWNRQLHKDFGVKSEKIFIFYTRKYRQYDRNWKWWFHVAPMVRVNGEKVVLDREFARGPLTEQEWEKKFNEPMRDKGYRCKRMSNISTYYSETNNRNEYCNIQIAPMYYWEPSDLKALENEGVVKNRWFNSEIKSAAAEIFRNWTPIYEEYKVP